MDRKAKFAIIWTTAATATLLITTYAALSRSKRTRRDAPVAGKKMKKLFLVRPHQDMNEVQLVVRIVDVPTPKRGEVLVRMCAASVNPSDYGAWKSPQKKRMACLSTPIPIGFEGAGIVVASGGGFFSRRLVGQAVGVITRKAGTYGEYLCVSATTGATPLPGVKGGHYALEDAASFFVNPYTVVAILDSVSAHRSKAFIHTAAASQLGQMIVKLSPQQDITVVNVVRRKDQAKMLKVDLGAEYVVCQADEDWQEQLAALVTKLDMKLVFDAVGGDMTGTLLSLLPSYGICYVYGVLAQKSVGNINGIDLIYKKKQVRGFILAEWMNAGGPLARFVRLRNAGKVVDAGLCKGGWAVSKFEDCNLDDMRMEFLKRWNGTGFTGSKLRIRMD